MDNTQVKKKNGLVVLISVLLVVTLAAVGTTVWVLFFRDAGSKVLAPDYAPVADDPYALPSSSEGEKNPTSEGGGSVTLSYGTDVSVYLGKKELAMNYENPYASSHDLVVQVVIKKDKNEYLLAQSGRLRPGYGLNKLDLLPDVVDKLAVGGYDGYFILSFYDPTSGEKAMVNSKVEVDIQVRN